MSASINGTTGITFPDASVQATAATGFGFKNRIINGACMIDQRNAGASVTVVDTPIYTLDRWAGYGSNASSKFSIQQNAGSVTTPVGFNKYLGATSTSSYSVPSGESYFIRHIIEGLNAADLGWGTANASTVTLSFWVRSSLTGTFGGSIQNSAQNRSYPFSYTILSANTWEQKTVTIAGDTTGTWLTDNGVGIRLFFSLGAGSSVSGTAGSWAGASYVSATGATSVVGTNGATFYITGVQLEKGSTATSFDYRPYGTELALCQRYFESYSSAIRVVGFYQESAYIYTPMQFLVEKRATPTVTLPSAANYDIWAVGAPSAVSVPSTSTRVALIQYTKTGLTNYYCYGIQMNPASGAISFSAEL